MRKAITLTGRDDKVDSKLFADSKRDTISNQVFRFLLDEIISLKIEPGRQLPEAEVAKRFDVSRQPVREAFLRLADLDLLLIRPQKATRVKKISLTGIGHTRFIRLAIEVEVVRVASLIATDEAIGSLQKNLDQQRKAKVDRDLLQLRSRDYDFHRLICEAANRPDIFSVVDEYKAHTNRICTLELADDDGMAETIDGHTKIFNAIVAKDPDTAAEMTRFHLSHLDSVLHEAKKKFPDFFTS